MFKHIKRPRIYSRESLDSRLGTSAYPWHSAIISFCDKDLTPINFEGRHERVFTVYLDDIDKDELKDYGLTEDSFFPEVDALAEFVFEAIKEGRTILCQCEHGQSRSAGCAAAILEYFEKEGILIFSSYSYYPNKLIFDKVLGALIKYERENDVSSLKK